MPKRLGAVAAFIFLALSTPGQALSLRSWIVYFENGPELTADAGDVIASATDYKTSVCPNERLILVAHTDSRGASSENLRRSAEFGLAVADELIRRGVPSEQITVMAMGETQPAVRTDDDTEEPLNRRVEIWFGEKDYRERCSW